MGIIIAGSIDLTKIDKSKIVEGKKGGKYLNVSIIVNDEKDKFGNEVSITESQSKEEREAKEKKNYLGNGKVVWQSHYEQKPKEKVQTSGSVDDIPF